MSEQLRLPFPDNRPNEVDTGPRLGDLVRYASEAPDLRGDAEATYSYLTGHGANQEDARWAALDARDDGGFR
jgi:hypothetical protein